MKNNKRRKIRVKARKSGLTAMLFIGPQKGAVEAARDAILRLLDARADQRTIRTAISEFARVCSVNNTTVDNFENK